MSQLTRPTLCSSLRLGTRAVTATATATKQTTTPFHSSAVLRKTKTAATDPLGTGIETPAKGRTGGGDKLSSSSPNAVPKPKISNLSVPGTDQTAKMTKEQKEEVDEHNRDFAKKHDHGNQAPDDKVDSKFWSGNVGEGKDGTVKR